MSALHDAASKGDAATVKRLLQGGTFRRPADVNARDSDGDTPLHLAAESGCAEAVRLLLQDGGDVHAREEGGNTPLHRACIRRHIDVIRMLLQHGADANASGLFG